MLDHLADPHGATPPLHFPARAFHRSEDFWASMQLVAVSIAVGALLVVLAHTLADAFGFPRRAVVGALLALLLVPTLKSFAHSIRSICVSSRGLEVNSLRGNRLVDWSEILDIAHSSAWRTGLGPGPTTVTSSAKGYVRIATRDGNLYFAPDSMAGFIRAVADRSAPDVRQRLSVLGGG